MNDMRNDILKVLVTEEELKEKLSSAGFEYDKDRNQFI